MSLLTTGNLKPLIPAGNPCRTARIGEVIPVKALLPTLKTIAVQLASSSFHQHQGADKHVQPDYPNAKLCGQAIRQLCLRPGELLLLKLLLLLQLLLFLQNKEQQTQSRVDRTEQQLQSGADETDRQLQNSADKTEREQPLCTIWADNSLIALKRKSFSIASCRSSQTSGQSASPSAS